MWFDGLVVWWFGGLVVRSRFHVVGGRTLKSFFGEDRRDLNQKKPRRIGLWEGKKLKYVRALWACFVLKS